MQILKKKENGKITFNIKGRLDNNSVEQFENELVNSFNQEISGIVIDIKDLEYVNSAGMRVLVGAQKQAEQNGTSLTIENINANIKSIFDSTGLSSFLNLK